MKYIKHQGGCVYPYKSSYIQESMIYLKGMGYYNINTVMIIEANLFTVLFMYIKYIFQHKKIYYRFIHYPNWKTKLQYYGWKILFTKI